MARPLRIEFPGAVYHVTSRGDRREPIFVDDFDRSALLGVLARATLRYDACVLAYCLMGNHYHFVLRTRQANLSVLMRHINGVFTQAFNQRHGKVGHLFQGRFKSILVDRDAYLLEVCRYVELNPVRAALVAAPGDWPWSSYRAHVGLAQSPDWLDTDGLHGHLLDRVPSDAAQRLEAARRYAACVAAAPMVSLWETALRQQIYLGDAEFVDRMQQQVEPPRAVARDIPRAQRGKPLTLAQWFTRCESRDEALYRAHVESGLSMSALAAELGLSVSRVSRLIARGEGAKGKT